MAAPTPQSTTVQQSSSGSYAFWEWEPRSFVVNPELQSMKVKKTKKLNLSKDSYWRFDIPTVKSEHDCWDLFMDEDQRNAWAVNADRGSADGYYMGRLNLRRLRKKDQFFRKNGTLDSVYIIKSAGTS